MAPGPEKCPRCGAPLSEGQRRTGSCPACLLGLGLEQDGEAAAAASTGRPAPASGQQTIGPYRILRSLGRGGMGEVFLAEQREPIRRRVALKVIKRGMDTKEVVSRFEAERQALALMDHPAIAKVFEAGETSEGGPYFAMEYIDGAPITMYCDERNLRVGDRLDLFVKVCEGVQHAHHKGVIHRDLKPTNVLVASQDGAAVPKIIDFGVAKATEKLTERTMVTELGLLVGTPEYMSPEQAAMSALDVDTRTDVYSLGVILYELLTGVLPFDARELLRAGFEEIRRTIREEEPSRPSMRLATLGERSTTSAKRRQVDVPTLTRELRGDLDWISLKALEKDRDRRYGSPAELAQDLRRHLSNEPVIARPPSAAYKLKKFVRRNRLLVGSGVTVFAVLIAGGVAATTFALREASQRREAERARSDLEKVVSFQAGMLFDVEPEEIGRRLLADLRQRIIESERQRGTSEADVDQLAQRLDRALDGVNGTDAALRVLDEEILERAARVIDTDFADEPLIEARLRDSLAMGYRKLGLVERAEPHARRALELRARELGDEHRDTIVSMQRLARQRLSQSRFEEAEALYGKALGIGRRVLGPDDPLTLQILHGLANTYRLQARYDEAEPLFLEALEARRRILGAQHDRTVDTMESLAALYEFTGRLDEAEPLASDVVEIRTGALGPEAPSTLYSMEGLARLHAKQGRYDESERLYREVLETQRRVRGSEHPDVVGSLNNLASLYARQLRFGEAAAMFRDSLEISERALGPDNFITITLALNLAAIHDQLGHAEEALPLILSGVKKLDRVVGAGHPLTLLTRCNLGMVYHHLERHDEARRVYEEAVNHPRTTAEVKFRFAWYLLEETPAKDIRLAVRHAEQADEMGGRVEIGPLHLLAQSFNRNGEARRAGSMWEKILARPDAGAPQYMTYAWFLLTREDSGPADYSTALEYAKRANELTGDEGPDYLYTLALAYHRTGRNEKAIETAERALSMLSPDNSAKREDYVERLEQYRAAARESDGS